MYNELKSYLDSLIAQGVPGLDCLLMKDGEVVFRYMAGVSDTQTQAPIVGNERYNVYSCSKMITCVAALQLVEQGKLSLTDKLSDYLPEYANMMVQTKEGTRPATSEILIRHLFTMTSGLTYEKKSPSMEQMRLETEGKCPTRQAIAALAREPLSFDPGTKWQYSLSHDVLAMVVEVVAGMPFEAYVKEHIFDPLHMNETTFDPMAFEDERMVPLYHYIDGKAMLHGRTSYSVHDFGPEFVSGGAGCISTVEDFAKFLEALRIGNVILKNETINWMISDQLSGEEHKTFWWSWYCSYGLGVQCPLRGRNDIGFGWSGAAGCNPIVHRGDGMTFFFARNVLGMNNDKINAGLVTCLDHIRSAWKNA